MADTQGPQSYLTCARCKAQFYLRNGTFVPGHFWCAECTAVLTKKYGPITGDKGWPLNNPAGDYTRAKPHKDDPVRYFTREQVIQFVAEWLAFVSKQSMSQPQYFRRMRALPPPEGERS